MRTSTLLAAALFAAIPAQAQGPDQAAWGREMCAAINRAVAAALGNFAAIRGADQGEGFYDTSLRMTMARRCDVMEMDGEWQWSCAWVGPPGQGQLVGFNYYQLAGACLPGWERRDYQARDSTISRVKARWTGRFTRNGVEVRISGTERENRTLGVHSQVELSVTRLIE